MRKHVAMGAAVAASALLLAGCSSPAAETPEESTGSAGEIVIWTDAEREAAITAAAEEFEAETGATVTLVQKNFEDLRNDFIAQVPTGEGPDITVGAHDWLGALVTAGVVDTIDLGERAADFEQVAIDAMTYEGQLYALPYSLETIALLQNTALVGDEAPATWDDMIASGLAAGTERPFVINTNGESGDGYTMYGLQTSFGAPVFVQDDSGSYTTEVGMGGAQGEAFAQWLAENGTAGTGYLSTTVDYDINNELFNSGQAPYTIQGPWAISAFPDVDVAVNPIPSAGGETAAPFVGVQGFFLSSQSDNALLATDFLVNHLATDDAQRALYEADPRIPALTVLADEVASDPIIAGFLASAQGGVPMPSIPEMGSVWDFWNAAEAQIINGADPVTTWNQMITDLEAALAG
ncbi:sugar ABC transporter substrate-binding protein [Microcella flavibacter]|uniref:sugar ABC transporter substrate-binding protein n=1 Tax=Microcella flavibacter TaxID=1804990 RepID=UPI0014570645|nr:extracellular solute-binding protein [Microcella flavibacter]